jgi:hypothetical protein
VSSPLTVLRERARGRADSASPVPSPPRCAHQARCPSCRAASRSTGGSQSTGSGIPSCQRAQLEERKNTSSVRLGRTMGSFAACCSSWLAWPSVQGRSLARSTALTARQGSRSSAIVLVQAFCLPVQPVARHRRPERAVASTAAAHRTQRSVETTPAGQELYGREPA